MHVVVFHGALIVMHFRINNQMTGPCDRNYDIFVSGSLVGTEKLPSNHLEEGEGLKYKTHFCKQLWQKKNVWITLNRISPRVKMYPKQGFFSLLFPQNLTLDKDLHKNLLLNLTEL